MMRRALPLLAALLFSCGTEPVILTATPDALVFTGFGTNPAPQTLQLDNEHGSRPWRAVSDVSWLTTLPPEGSTTPMEVTVVANADGLPGGLASGKLRLSAAGGAIEVPVILDVPDATGTWTGQVLGQIGVILALKDSSGVITGQGAFTGGGNQLGLTVGGTHAHPYLIFSLNAPGFIPATVSVVFETPTKMTGLVTGSSFNNEPLTLTRQ